MKPFLVSAHAEKRAKERGVPHMTFWVARHQAFCENLVEHLKEQQRKLLSMLTDKEIRARVGTKQYIVSKTQISTRLDVGGYTVILGIRREGEGYSPLTVETVWN